MNIIGIIPARMASSRFPGKPMATILDIPMIGHVFFRSKMSNLLENVYVATCDQVIFDYISEIGGMAIMTSNSHERASDRVSEALKSIEEKTGRHVDIIVMIQGDEPMVHPEMIDEAFTPMIQDESILVANLMTRIKSTTEHDDHNEIKVVVDQNNFALYFSREPIPSRVREGENSPFYKQVCIIPFRRDFLMKYCLLEPTPLEISESVDMLRVLEHGHKVKMIQTQYDVYSVDTEADRQKVEKLMKNDDLIQQYR